MSCPPLTRHTAANSSNTRAFVLHNNSIRSVKYLHQATLESRNIHTGVPLTQGMDIHPLPGVPVVQTERDFVHTARVAHHKVEARLSRTKINSNRNDYLEIVLAQ